MRIQDRQGRGPKLLAAATDELVAAARKSPLFLAPTVFSPFSANTPQVFVDIDQVKAQKLGVPIQNVTDTIQTYFGSTYVNDFNLFGRTYHVTAQADLPFRKERSDLARLRTRNANAASSISRTSRAPIASPATISIRRPSCRAKACRGRVRQPRSPL
jgi:multidrug efflux pump subunit AcrB